MENENMIIDVKSSAREPFIIIGLPDVGLVGFIAVTYMIEELRMKEIGYMDTDIYHPLIIVKNGEIKRPIRFYEDGNIIAVTSDIPITPALSIEFATKLIDWAKSVRTRLIINTTGIPVPNRMSIDNPKVLGVATYYNKEVKGIKPFSDGWIMGTYASIIKESYNNKIPSLTLLAETYLNFPDPTASFSILSIIRELLNIDIDLKRLEEEGEVIKLKVRELMKQTEGAITRSKVGVPSIYR